jgi:hypothetical protein
MSEKRMVKVYRRDDGKPIRFLKEPSRNDMCPCGSGKKFKQCHIGNFEELVEQARAKFNELVEKAKQDEKTI